MRAALFIALFIAIMIGVSGTGRASDRIETLEAIMSHPRDPHYDVLRPMSGRWARCRATVDDPGGVAGLQDIFASSDHLHFIRTLVKTSDSLCATPISSERRSYECDSLAKETLSCRLTKVESKAGGHPVEEAGWSAAPLSESDVRKGALTISMKLLTPKKKHKASFKKPQETDDGRRLEVRIAHADAPSAGDAESITLQFMSDRSTSSPANPSSSSRH